MEDNIIIPVIDTLYSKGRHHNINIICVGHAVTDLITKARENTPASRENTPASNRRYFK